LTDYRVELEAYNGPLDLLLFLIRREEVDIQDIPVARITGQYLEYVGLLHELDPEGVSEFLVVAATLVEIKSRMLLPRPPAEEVEDHLGDPRFELVRQLLQYQRFKEAARGLEEAADIHHRRHPRVPAVAPEDEDGVELDSVEVWDLFDAFRRLMEQIGRAGPTHQVSVDDTPVTLHAEDMLDSLQRSGGIQRFDEIFSGRTRGEMIGLFLALLELIRQRRVRASQDAQFAPILLHLIDATPLDQTADDAYTYQDATGPFRSAPKEDVTADAAGMAEIEPGLAAEGAFDDEDEDEEDDDEFLRNLKEDIDAPDELADDEGAAQVRAAEPPPAVSPQGEEPTDETQ
jgi:segregation and condensation protein A